MEFAWERSAEFCCGVLLRSLIRSLPRSVLRSLIRSFPRSFIYGVYVEFASEFAAEFYMGLPCVSYTRQRPLPVGARGRASFST